MTSKQTDKLRTTGRQTANLKTSYLKETHIYGAKDLKSRKKKKRDITPLIIASVTALLVCVTIMYFVFMRPGVVTGRVVASDNQNISLSDASISLDGKNLSVNNNLTGTFYLSGIKPGEHTLKVTRENYQPFQKKFTVKAGQTVNFNIPLSLMTAETAVMSEGFAVANSSSSDVYIVDPQTLTVKRTISSGTRTMGIAALPEKEKIYASALVSKTISVIDMNTMTETSRIQLEKGLTQPSRLAFSPSKDRLYAMSFGSPIISVIDTNTDEQVKPDINTGKIVADFSVDNNGNLILLTESQVLLVSESGSVMRTFDINFPGLRNLTYDEMNSKIFISGNAGLLVLDLISGDTKKINVEGVPRKVIADSAGKFVYVILPGGINILNSYEDFASVNYIASTGSDFTDAMQLNEKIFLTDEGSNTLSVFDTVSESFTKSVKVGNSPKAVSYWNFN